MGKQFEPRTDEALRRIAKAQETDAAELDLSGLELTSLPAEIGSLSSLQILMLKGGGLVTLPPEIGLLRSLHTLRIIDNCLTTLPPEIGLLTALRVLNLSFNNLSTLPPQISSLTSLRGLYLNNNQLVAFPAHIASLTSLQEALFEDNQLTTLPAVIGSLTALRVLNLSGNKLTALPPQLASLTSLQRLNLNNNQLTELPPEIASLTSLQALFLHGNPALGLPPEVLGPPLSITDAPRPEEILAYYFRSVRAGQRKPILEAKVVLVGFGGVGKTSLRRRLVDGTFDPKEQQTHKIEITPWKTTVGNDEVKLHVWDFGGQEIMHSTHQFFLTERTLYVLVLARREKLQGTFDAEYWLRTIRAIGSSPPTIVVANKQLGCKFELNRETLQERYPFIRGFVETDCDPPLRISDLSQMIRRELDHVEELRQPFDAKWLRIKSAVTDLKRQGKKRITVTEFYELCAKEGESEQRWQKFLLDFFHKLGLIVCFQDDPRVSDDGVLDAQWVVDGIYRILNENSLQGGDGQVTTAQMRTLLPEGEYSDRDLRVVQDLMEKFGLCFRLGNSLTTVVVPELMTEREGEWKRQFSPPDKCLLFQLKYDFLPEGLLPRFIVGTHDISQPGERWRSGVILRRERCAALIRANSAGVPPTIEIMISGPPGAARDLLSAIRREIEKTNSTYPDLDVKERVPIRGRPDIEPLEYDRLLTREAAGKKTVEIELNGEIIDLRLDELLEGVEPKAKRVAREAHLRGDVIYGDKHVYEGSIMKFNMRDNYGQIAELMENCTNTVNQQSPGEKKSLMEELQMHVTELINRLPEDKRAKAEEIAENLEDVLKQSGKERPNAEKFGVSAKGLLEAASWVKDFSGKIGGTLLNLGKLALGAAYVLPKLGA